MAKLVELGVRVDKALHKHVRTLRGLLTQVEYVDAGGDLYCPFCGASSPKHVPVCSECTREKGEEA